MDRIRTEEQTKPVASIGYTKPTIEDLWVYRPQIYTCFYQKVHDPERAEDLTQETYLRAWRYLDSFQPGPGSRLFSWLYRIAIRTAIDAWRSEQCRPQISIEETDALVLLSRQDGERTMEDTIIERVLRQRAFASLSHPLQRTLVRLSRGKAPSKSEVYRARTAYHQAYQRLLEEDGDAA